MISRADFANFQDLVLTKRPIIDVRAPIEFARGSAPNTVNLPLLDDEQRSTVGTTYKVSGRDRAIDLGNQLISGEVKATRLAHWRSYAEQNRNALIMCARGGMRSTIVQHWLHDETGILLPKVSGGFKALRQFYMAQFEQTSWQHPLILIAGHTGAGKTKLLTGLNNTVDLEGIANHRGSSFGNYVDDQPTQINFENQLASAFIELRAQHPKAIIIEKEGKNIGKSRLPLGLIERMSNASIVVVHADIEQRTDNSWQEYVVEDLHAYQLRYGKLGFQHWSTHVRTSIEKLKRRLGSTRTEQAIALFDSAVSTQQLADFKPLIRFLLEHYYDPMYSYQKQKWTQKILFEGIFDDVVNFLDPFTAKE